MRSFRKFPLLVAIVLPTLLAACTPPSSRAGRLLTIAGEEANLIDTLDQRLTRQLNIADMQIQDGQKAEAVKTLGLATATLKAEPKDPKLAISDFRRIAGWTSVAQLARSAGDDKSAIDAYSNAVNAINSVQPVATRAQYVLSLSEVCYNIRGKGETIELLVKGGEWAREIDDKPTRRYALWCFAQALVGYDALEPARTVMRNEPDAGWRSDALASMAQIEMRRSSNTKGGEFFVLGAADLAAKPGMAAATMAEAEREKQSSFNKKLGYYENFRQNDVQQGQRPD